MIPKPRNTFTVQQQITAEVFFLRHSLQYIVSEYHYLRDSAPYISDSEACPTQSKCKHQLF
jgi:hypothetical protein